MHKTTIGVACALSLALATRAVAADVASGSVQLSSASAVQLGRLSRNSVQQDWTGTETYPGVINSGTAYAYETIAAPFTANAFQAIYYDITFDDDVTDLFASAYMDSYNPANKALNWLGDAGSSGNYFPGDARFFDVVVPTGHNLVFVVNSSAGTNLSSTANYFITAYSDTEYSENFLSSPVPEPATWAMMFLGFLGIGAALRRRVRIGEEAHSC